jgi:hypothetical protein
MWQFVFYFHSMAAKILETSEVYTYLRYRTCVVPEEH